MANILHTFFLILGAIYLITSFLTGLYLLIRSYQTRLRSTTYLGIGIFIGALSQIASDVFKANRFVEVTGLTVFFLFSLLFINETFHKNKEEILSKVILIISIFNLGLNYYLSFVFSYAPSLEIHYIFYIQFFIERAIIFYWGAWSSYSAYNNIKNKDVRPWIKMRYKLLAISFFIMVVQPFLLVFLPYGSSFGDPEPIGSLIIFGIGAILILIFGITTLLVWVMPNWLKKYFDRNYKEVLEEREFTDEEIISEIKKEIENQ